MGICSTRSRLQLVVVAVLQAALAGSLAVVVANLHDDWDVEWAPQNVRFTQDGNGMALSVASSSSTGCRLRTKKPFIYGTISSLIKLVPGNSAGTIATLYASTVGRRKHEEIDFEFIGNVAGRPYTINTNIYTADDPDGKEVEFTPWFDATAGFHNYTVSWSPCMVAWYVDGVPIRVFRNYDEARDRVAFPRTQPMYGFLSIWQTDGAWATHNGASRTDWSKAPFVASYRRVNLDVGGRGGGACRLSPAQLRRMQAVQRKYKGYDYCNNKGRFKGHMPHECSLPQF